MTDQTETAVVPAAQPTAEAPAPVVPVAEEESTAKVEPEAETPTVEHVVRRWAIDTLGNSPLSQDTRLWNLLQAALPELITALESM